MATCAQSEGYISEEAAPHKATDPNVTDPKAPSNSPNTEEQDPNTEEQDPNTGEQDPNTEEQDPNTGEQDPNTEEQDPNTEEQDPNTEEQDPNTEEQDPNAEEQDPNTEETSADRGAQSAALTPHTVRNMTNPALRRLLTPNPDGEEPDDEEPDDEEYASILPPIIVSDEAYTYEERVALICDEMIGQSSSAEDADDSICCYMLQKLASKGSWIAVWKAAPEILLEHGDIGDLPFVGVLVEVKYLAREGRKSLPRMSVSVAEPFSSNIANLPRELVEEVLREHDSSVAILDVYPIQGQGAHVDSIAESLEHARFFYNFLWREWDDDEAYDEYAGLIEKRIQLHYHLQDGTIPASVCERYRKTLDSYRSKRLELTKFQSSVHGDALPGEAVECWKMYYEMMMLSGLLKLWEDMLLSHGRFYPRIYKRRRGRRASGRPVTHIVAQMMTADMFQNFPSDTLIQQHDGLSAALESCYSGDTVVLFPGEYQAVALTALADDIIIKGEGEREEVVLVPVPSQDNFVASKASQVTLSNLTLLQRGGCEGVVVVEAGRMTLDSCVLRCAGAGVSVLTGASLLMRNCQISGAQGPAVELLPGSAAELHGNQIHHCSNQPAKGPQGAINLKVLPKPQLKMSDNHIHDNLGYGMSVLVPESQGPAGAQALEDSARGDQREPDLLSKALQELSLEMNTNKLESNAMGNIGVLRKTWLSC